MREIEKSIFGTGLAAALMMMYLELRDVRSQLHVVKEQIEFLAKLKGYHKDQDCPEKKNTPN